MSTWHSWQSARTHAHTALFQSALSVDVEWFSFWTNQRFFLFLGFISRSLTINAAVLRLLSRTRFLSFFLSWTFCLPLNAVWFIKFIGKMDIRKFFGLIYVFFILKIRIEWQQRHGQGESSLAWVCSFWFIVLCVYVRDRTNDYYQCWHDIYFIVLSSCFGVKVAQTYCYCHHRLLPSPLFFCCHRLHRRHRYCFYSCRLI